MEMLPNSSSGQKSPLVEKIIRYGVPIAAGIAVFWFWGTISAFVAMATKNLFNTLLYGIPSAAVIGAVVLYPTFWWMQYKNLVHWFMSGLIKLDPLSFMDRYVDILSDKLANLNRIRVMLKGKYVESERKIQELTKGIDDNLKRGAAAKQMKDLETASLCGSRAQGMQNSVRLYTPNYERMKKSLEFLDALAKNWGVSIIKLREEVARKREEFEFLRAQAEGVKEAEAFLSGDTAEGKIYQESLKALEESVTHKIAYIEDFELRSKDIMAGIKVDNQMQHDEGLTMLDQYMQDGKLILPEDYSVPLKKFDLSKVPEAQVVKNSFNLLD